MAIRRERERRSAMRLMISAILFPVAIMTLLALISYDWHDIYIFENPPNSPPANFIGLVGAWSSFFLFVILGVGAYTIPVWMFVLALFFVMSKREQLWPKIVWCLFSLLSLAALIDLHELFLTHAAHRNMTDPGGMLSRLFTRGLMIRWISPVGTGIVIWSIFLLSVLMLIGLSNLLALYNYLVAAVEVIISHLANRASERGDRRLSIEREEKRLEKQRKRLEKEMRKKKLADDIAAKAEEKSRTKAAAVKKKPPPKKEPAPAPEPEPRPVEIDPDTARFPNYVVPPLSLLNDRPVSTQAADSVDTEATGRILVETLGEFGIETEVTDVETGPVVASYELLPAKGIRVERIAGLANNIALALKATSIRVQAPIPGKGVVGIEVPNAIANVVYLKEMLDGKSWRSGKATLPLALGKDVGGNDIVADLSRMPHLLIAGATGSGKSVCINAILAGLLMSKTPDELRLILVDPKIVEFSVYNHLPHLVVPIITDPKKVALSLRWAITEMEKRYKLFAKVKVRNIDGFNNRHKSGQQDLFGAPPKPNSDIPDRVPYIVIVIDELADLMLAAGADIENSVARLAQLSRAVGIHMIIATQRPSVNVITGTIKANFPARIAFQVAQKVDSRTILDQSGADKLLGRGDMLYLPPATSKLLRAQGAIIDDDEIHRVVEYIKEQAEPSYEMEIQNKLEQASAPGGSIDAGEDDDLLTQAVEIIKETHRASTSSLQRRLRIGYTRAARLMDILEERGIIGPPHGSDPREILIDLDVDAAARSTDTAEDDVTGDQEDPPNEST